MTRSRAISMLKHAQHTSTTLNEAFRKTMGSIASQVMILTASHQPAHPTQHAHSVQKNQYKGATLSSVVSLSMNPSPLLQFNLKVPSFTSENLHHNGLMALHVLTPTKESGELARNFSRNGRVIGGKFVSASPFDGLVKGEDYEYYENYHSGVVLPVLKKVSKVMVCKKRKVFRIQDHEVWIVQVVDVLHGDFHEKEGGLLNFNRKFHNLGEDVE